MDKILIVDFGSQYTQLIARKVRELNVFSEIFSFNSLPPLDNDIKGVILSGSPYSVKEKDSPTIDLKNLYKNLPVLGICYGAQLMAEQLSGKVSRSEIREYGRATLQVIDNTCPLLKNITSGSQIWMSHSDTVVELPEGFTLAAGTENIPVAAFYNRNKNLYGIQFHPEVHHTTEGKKILFNFLTEICKCKQEWTPAHFISDTINKLKISLQNDKVVLGLSGGIDSTVAASILHKTIGQNLYCIFVDNGLLRKNEFEDVLKAYKNLGLNIIPVNASAEFYKILKNVTDPELKRKNIGKAFIDIFEKEAKKIEGVKWLGQGTIYPDVIESAGTKGPAAKIKSHHNVGGLPEKMNLGIIEPLRMLFKDEVRLIARELNVPENIYKRHPFPGPGLAVRILGEVTTEKVSILQEADHIFINELKSQNLYDEIWQAATILLPVKSVGVMGDERTYEFTAVLRAVTSTDGMTADWYPLPHKFLAEVSNKIINKVKGINRVVYDISSKPPATIEWE